MFCCRNNNVLIQAVAADPVPGIAHLMVYALYLSRVPQILMFELHLAPEDPREGIRNLIDFYLCGDLDAFISV